MIEIEELIEKINSDQTKEKLKVLMKLPDRSKKIVGEIERFLRNLGGTLTAISGNKGRNENWSFVSKEIFQSRYKPEGYRIIITIQEGCFLERIKTEPIDFTSRFDRLNFVLVIDDAPRSHSDELGKIPIDLVLIIRMHLGLILDAFLEEVDNLNEIGK